jgi:hypothetical protein
MDAVATDVVAISPAGPESFDLGWLLDRHADQALREIGIDPPVARRVRIGQRIARDLTVGGKCP